MIFNNAKKIVTLEEGDGDEDLEAEEDLDVLNPKEWILLEISFEALSTTPGVLTLIAVIFDQRFLPIEWHLETKVIKYVEEAAIAHKQNTIEGLAPQVSVAT